jgi:hypothetical protein
VRTQSPPPKSSDINVWLLVSLNCNIGDFCSVVFVGCIDMFLKVNATEALKETKEFIVLILERVMPQ